MGLSWHTVRRSRKNRQTSTEDDIRVEEQMDHCYATPSRSVVHYRTNIRYPGYSWIRCSRPRPLVHKLMLLLGFHQPKHFLQHYETSMHILPCPTEPDSDVRPNAHTSAVRLKRPHAMNARGVSTSCDSPFTSRPIGMSRSSPCVTT